MLKIDFIGLSKDSGLQPPLLSFLTLSKYTVPQLTSDTWSFCSKSYFVSCINKGW